LLSEHTSARVVVAGRNREAAAELAESLNRRAGEDRALPLALDAADADAVREAFAGADLVVALTATPDLVSQFAEAASASGIDYIDCHFQDSAHEALAAVRDDLLAAGCRVISQAGFHPGLPAAFVRASASHFDQIEDAAVAMVMHGHVDDPHGLSEIIELIQTYHAEIFEEDHWRSADWTDNRRFDFGEGFGICSCNPLQLLEMRDLPAALGLERLGVYVAGWTWFADWIVTPMAMLAGKFRKGLGKKLFSRMMRRSINRSRRPEAVVFLTESNGRSDGRSKHLRIEARDSAHPYHFTAAGIVAAVLQVLDDPPKPPGLHLMGDFVDPTRLFEDLERMGVAFDVQESLREADAVGG
jgi:saccharopine dehydrogenase (NAD+, L-lysine-forming)